jgi:hypothetical protein
MRRLVLILLTFIAVVTFIRAFDDIDDEMRRASEAKSEHAARTR